MVNSVDQEAGPHDTRGVRAALLAPLPHPDTPVQQQHLWVVTAYTGVLLTSRSRKAASTMSAAGFEPGSSRSKADSLTSRPSCAGGGVLEGWNPLTHAFIHPFTRTLIHPLTHTLIHPLIHPLTHTLIHPLTRFSSRV
ncbi:hypothetical protein FHG87_022060 [Trinorchestia longiramus]|nr:hypothetical protein FHG87_022060 [Trinorchestia longiramus]